ncbi:ROK family transcriptional regulator [Microbacterium sp. ZW T5_56]|uniref:ROK family transcriptional regulator n=1 Tax=Microbacterium sp. ZW T5_56 TaxID=3378081 RepID=UPI003852F5F5
MLATSEMMTPPSAGRLLSLVRSGVASTRADLARLTGLSGTTVTQRVDDLISAGYLRDAGEGSSRGGRRPRLIAIDPNGGVVAAVDIGATGTTIGILDLASGILARDVVRVDLTAGPQRSLEIIAEHARVLAERAAAGPLLGFGVGLPGPVDSRSHRLVTPSQLPGWDGVDVAALLSASAGLPVIVDNDADIMALGEAVSDAEPVESLVFVKVDASIGCGVIANGRLYRGTTGFAGDISHVTVPEAPDVACSCGRRRCLDAISGGSALVAAMAAAGIEVTMHELVELGRQGHPQATTLLRQAGMRTGTVLATIVNFFNPRQLVLGGAISEADAFVAGVRAAVYAECLPMISAEVDIVSSAAGPDAGLLGAARIILDHVFDEDRIDAEVTG